MALAAGIAKENIVHKARPKPWRFKDTSWGHTLTIENHLGNNGCRLPHSLGHGCELVRSPVHCQVDVSRLLWETNVTHITGLIESHFHTCDQPSVLRFAKFVKVYNHVAS